MTDPSDPTPRETPISKLPPAPFTRLDGLPCQIGSLLVAWDNYLRAYGMRPRYHYSDPK